VHLDGYTICRTSGVRKKPAHRVLLLSDDGDLMARGRQLEGDLHGATVPGTLQIWQEPLVSFGSEALH